MQRPAVVLGVMGVAALVAAILFLREEPAPPPETGEVVQPANAPHETLSDLPEGPAEETDAQPLALPTATTGPATVLIEEDDALLETSIVIAQGTVRYADGRPAPDTEVLLFESEGENLASVYCEDDGSFELEWEEPLGAGWVVATEAPFYAEEEALDAVVPDTQVQPRAFVPGDPPVTCQLVLRPAPRIEGRVVSAETGQPLDFADVTLVCMLPEWREEMQWTTTDELGHYALPIVDMAARGLLVWCESEDLEPAAAGPLDLEPGELRVLDFRLGEAAPLEGRVISAADGTPIVDADVTLLPVHPELEDAEAWDLTWEDGSFELDASSTPRQFWQVHVEAEGFLPALVAAGETRGILEIRLQAPAEIRGRVVEQGTRKPVADADVTLRLRTRTGMLVDDVSDEASTVADGSFELLLQSTPVEGGALLVEAEGYRPYSRQLAELLPQGSAGPVLSLSVELEPLPAGL